MSALAVRNFKHSYLVGLAAVVSIKTNEGMYSGRTQTTAKIMKEMKNRCKWPTT